MQRPLLLLRKHRNERGSTMVETALVLVAFLMFLIGIADVGQFLFIHESLVERVRGALRYGVITYDTTAIRNMVLYGTTSPANGAVPSFNLTSSMVSVARKDANAPEDRVVITVSNYPILFLTPFIAGTATGKPIVGVQPMELGNLP
jgi:TadE-like protein